jgi:hypothetical protein
MGSEQREWSFAHEQTRQAAVFYVKNRFKRRQRARRVTVPLGGVPTVEIIGDAENLIDTFYRMKAAAVQAPGPDGVTYTALGPAETWDAIRAAAKAVRDGTYRPGPTRQVLIPKPSGGARPLRIGNLIDRVVAAALNRALEPLWETTFLDGSMGFRPDRGSWRMLAEMEAVMTRDDRWVIASDDIRNAFGNVRIDDALADHRTHIQDQRLLALIERVLRGHDGRSRHVGIDQGSPYSPAALNLRLHEAHDLGAVRDRLPPWYRYADNVVYLCKGVPEGLQVLDWVGTALGTVGFSLKGEDGPPADLRNGDVAKLLGFTLSLERGTIRYGLAETAWATLEKYLHQAYEADNPPETAVMAINGWLNAFGPALGESRDDILRRVRLIASSVGFRETGPAASLNRTAETSWVRWGNLRQQASCRLSGGGAG